MKMRMVVASMFTVAVLGGGLATASPAPDSKRLAQGKDYVADEQWSRAIVEFTAAAADRTEKNRDEALFWLAHSQHQAGDDASALQTIVHLEREYPASRWVPLAHSVRVEIAQRMHRDDVLWVIARPPAPPPPTAPVARLATVAPTPPTPQKPTTPPLPTPRAAAVAVGPAIAPAAAPLPPPPPATPPAPAPFGAVPPAAVWWVGTTPEPTDQVVRIEALAGLLDAHSERVIPLLKDIALDPHSPNEARHAVFVLAHSDRPEAHHTVLEVATAGAEPARIAAIRELARFQDINVSSELMRVYDASPAPGVRRQVVTSLGERNDHVSLVRIVKAEQDSGVRNTAIMTLGRIPTARDQLRLLYHQAPADSREAVISALFTARDDDELIRIASTEKNAMFRQQARQQLRLLATPKAAKYLTDNP
jgi:hypothetical protein